MGNLLARVDLMEWSYVFYTSIYSKTPIYRAPIYRVPRFTGPISFPPKFLIFSQEEEGDSPELEVELDRFML